MTENDFAAVGRKRGPTRKRQPNLEIDPIENMEGSVGQDWGDWETLRTPELVKWLRLNLRQDKNGSTEFAKLANGFFIDQLVNGGPSMEANYVRRKMASSGFVFDRDSKTRRSIVLGYTYLEKQ